MTLDTAEQLRQKADFIVFNKSPIDTVNRVCGGRYSLHGYIFEIVINNKKAGIYRGKENKNYIAAEDWNSIPSNCCRACKKEITKKYNNIYFEEYSEHAVLYCFNNNYCEECAKAKSEKKHKIFKPLKVLKDSEHFLSGETYPTRVIEFEGFTIQSNDAWAIK